MALSSIVSAIALLVWIFSCTSYLDALCSNGRPAFQALRLSDSEFAVYCSTPGESCYYGIGRCSKEHLCCPGSPKMSDRKSIRDRATNINFKRVGDDFRDMYRLFQLELKSNNHSQHTDHFRWSFFEDTLRDLFEMPRARFRYAITNCMEKKGLAWALVPLNATSIITSISAMTIVSRKPETPQNLDVCYLATRKEHRRRGLGTRLLQEIVQQALSQRGEDVHNVVIQVNTLNNVALELYERCGWRCFAQLAHYLDPDPHHATNHAFSLLLPLYRVRNVSALCRDRSAVDADPWYDQMSISRCRRTPVQF